MPFDSNVSKMFVCGVENCTRRFQRKFDLKNHRNQVHLNENVPMTKCLLCGMIFMSDGELQDHFAVIHKPSRRFVKKDSAFGKKFVTWRYNFLATENQFDMSQSGIRRLIYNKILAETAQSVIARISLIFIAEMVMADHQGDRITTAMIPFRAPSFYANAHSKLKLDQDIRKAFWNQKDSMDTFINSGSNWQFSKSIAFDIEISHVNPVRGGCNLSVTHFKNKLSLYSPKNHKANLCFLACIAYFILFGAAVNHKHTPIDNFKIIRKMDTFNMKNIKTPLSIDEVKKFLSKNKNLDLKINILFRTVKDEIYPLEYGIGEGSKVVNILLCEAKEIGHYMLIKNADKFLKHVYNVNSGKKLSYGKQFFCLNCFNHFSSPKLREEHESICCLNKPRIETTPKPGENIVKFKNFERSHDLEYVGYLDFECVLANSNMPLCSTCNTLKCKCDYSYVTDVNSQEPICYSLVILNGDTIVHEHTYAGEDAHVNLIGHLLEQERKWIGNVLSSNADMLISRKEIAQFERATHCYLCGIEFTDMTVKCKDHSHFNSKYLGAACQSCNLRRQMPKRLKIFAHNSSRYDMHFLIKAIAYFKDDITGIDVLPYNGENFRTFRFNCFEFLDSIAFLQASLAQLCDDLSRSGNEYKILKQTYLVSKDGVFDDKRFNMVLGKSFFPYEYCTSYEKMLKTKKIPKRQSFYSSLSEKSISKDDHKFARSVWKEFQCRNLVDYTKLYCKIDTILLAQVFQAFRHAMKNFSSLDPAYYISLPAYGYDSMLKITRSQIELPTDINMVQYLEQCKRGGVSFINTRYLHCNHFEKGSIMYLDANNLYGAALSEKLPLKDFRWLSKREIEVLDLSQDFDGDKGYIVECDLHYPSHLHESHSNLPLAPEILEVGFDNLSPFTKDAMKKTEGVVYKDVKLMSTFHDRKNYVLHVKNLKLYIELGMVLKGIHRALEFTQDYIIAPYIEKTTAARKQATSKFEMDLFKKLVKILS